MRIFSRANFAGGAQSGVELSRGRKVGANFPGAKSWGEFSGGNKWGGLKIGERIFRIQLLLVSYFILHDILIK